MNELNHQERKALEERRDLLALYHDAFRLTAVALESKLDGASRADLASDAFWLLSEAIRQIEALLTRPEIYEESEVGRKLLSTDDFFAERMPLLRKSQALMRGLL